MSRPAKPRNPLDDLVGYRLRRVSVALMADLGRDLAGLGLRPTEASVLLLIAANPGLTQSDVGRMLGIQRANMAPLTAGLDRRGLVRRDRVDGRSHGLVVTDAGAALCGRARAAMDRHDALFLERLSPGARDGLVEALERLSREAGDAG